jgi:tetratricopeptide (TPR) repeat protein
MSYSKGFFSSLLVATLLTASLGCRGDQSQESQAPAGAEGTPPANTAIADLSRQIEQGEGNKSGLYAARGYLWYENENFDEAIADVEKAIELDSSKVEYYHALADIYLDYYKSRKALYTMEKAASLFPNRIPTLLKLAEFQLILKQHQPALLTLERIRALEPLNPEMFFMFGNVFFDMGRKDEAMAAYQSAVEQDPDLIDAWIKLGTLLADKGSAQSEKYFDNALRVDSNSIDALHAKAYFLSNKKDDLNGAIRLYRKINVINPQYVDGYYNMGLIFLDMDSAQQAYQSFDLAIKFDPALAGAYYHRGLAAEKMGNKEQARSDYKNTLNIDSDFEAAKAALRNIK